MGGWVRPSGPCRDIVPHFCIFSTPPLIIMKFLMMNCKRYCSALLRPKLDTKITLNHHHHPQPKTL